MTAANFITSPWITFFFFFFFFFFSAKDAPAKLPS
jgi:hypothetical protein